jgi:hypothetical protein
VLALCSKLLTLAAACSLSVFAQIEFFISAPLAFCIAAIVRLELKSTTSRIGHRCQHSQTVLGA